MIKHFAVNALGFKYLLSTVYFYEIPQKKPKGNSV